MRDRARRVELAEHVVPPRPTSKVPPWGVARARAAPGRVHGEVERRHPDKAVFVRVFAVQSRRWPTGANVVWAKGESSRGASVDRRHAGPLIGRLGAEAWRAAKSRRSPPRDDGYPREGSIDERHGTEGWVGAARRKATRSRWVVAAMPSIRVRRAMRWLMYADSRP